MVEKDSGRPTGADTAADGTRGTWIPVDYLPELGHIGVNVLATLLVAQGALVAHCSHSERPATLDALWPEGKAGSPQGIIDRAKGWSLTEIVHHTCQPHLHEGTR